MTVIYLALPLPTGSSSRPGNSVRHPTSAEADTFPYLALLQVGFSSISTHAETWCALTAPFHPCLCPTLASGAIGGLVSVALSIASRRLGVTQHPAWWSPDFPPRQCRGDRPALSVNLSIREGKTPTSHLGGRELHQRQAIFHGNLRHQRPQNLLLFTDLEVFPQVSQSFAAKLGELSHAFGPLVQER